ncbi:MAG: NAD-dependent epimerase/dehydratase family protein [Bacteroidia bacterium]|nr:NAD-dependent epimerase/dehydratase family protein [Bacteroidia bacterium]MDW8159216.1 NAD-dependent epimerase/dehydratase family protein [Bacteroidia bacterium]
MASTDTKILVIGAFGQLGSELVPELVKIYGRQNIIVADIYPNNNTLAASVEELDVVNKKQLEEILRKHSIAQIYHLAALLSASGEQHPQLAWEVNMQGLLNVLDLGVQLGIEKIFWPSSIAVFGPNSPKVKTPQLCIMDPTSIYGITKLAGERLCEYYHYRYGLDVRSLRYPGLIGYNAMPGGGTTDYALHIFYEAISKKSYACFLKEDARLPMMYMPDAIRATIELMQAPVENITVRTSYNLSAFDFTPAEIATEIKKYIPDFKCTFAPDFRQKIAESWPNSIDDSIARRDWGWQEKYTLSTMTAEMIQKISEKENMVVKQI